MNALPCPLGALHHVTSITKDLAESHAFHTVVLGLQLSKGISPENDDKASYFYYASDSSRDSELSFFEWPKANPFVPGVGLVSETGLLISGNQLNLMKWAERLKSFGLSVGAIEPFHHCPSLSFQSLEGQAYRLIANPLQSIHQDRSQVLGLGSVSLAVKSPDLVRDFLIRVLQFSPCSEDPYLLESSPNAGMGSLIQLIPSQQRGCHGSGGVHHVAWQVANEHELDLWKHKLTELGVIHSGITDCALYKSLYFRLPEGMMFEIATRSSVGFVDEYARLWGARHVSQRLSHAEPAPSFTGSEAMLTA